MNQIRIVIGRIHGYIIQEPVRRKKVVCGLKIRKLYLGDDEGRKIAEKNVQLNGIGITGQQITALGNDASVRLLNQMPVGLFVQGEVVFFSGKKALSFISELVIIFIPAHTDNGVRVQIALFDQTAGIPLQVFRQLFYCKFPLDFHSVLQSAAAGGIKIRRKNGVSHSLARTQFEPSSSLPPQRTAFSVIILPEELPVIHIFLIKNSAFIHWMRKWILL